MKYINVVVIFIVFLIFEFTLDHILDYNFVNKSNYWLSLLGFVIAFLLVSFFLTKLLNKKTSEKG